MSLFTDDLIISVENPKEETTKLLELIRDSSQFAEYKINIQKLIGFLYMNNEQVDFDIKNILFALISKMKYLDINIIKIYKIYMWKTVKL